MKIPPVGAELFHADGQTDMTKLIVAFRNFVNAPESEKELRTNWQMRNSLDPVFGTIYL
jgi:hypothetical protein